MNELPDLRERVAALEAGLLAARAAGNSAAEANRAAELGDLRYRLGDARGAFDSLVLALQLGAGDDDPEADLALEVAASLAARRAGFFDEAALGLGRALEHYLAADPVARSALTAEAALTASLAGDPERAATLFAEAVKAARLSDGVEAMVHTLWLRGEGALCAGRTQEAAAAFSRALEVAQEAQAAGDVEAREAAGEAGVDGGEAGVDDDESGDTGPAVAPAELLAVLLGLHASGAASDEILLGALALLPDALAEAESWWSLPRVLPGLLRLADAGYLGEASRFEPLRITAAAALQREDCAQHHEALRLLLRFGSGTFLSVT